MSGFFGRTDLEQSRQCLHSQEKSILNRVGHGGWGLDPRARGGGSGRSGEIQGKTRLKTKSGWAGKTPEPVLMR